MKAPETPPPPHKLGANRHDPAHHRHVAKHPTAESRDVREDRSVRQSKAAPRAQMKRPRSTSPRRLLLAREKGPVETPPTGTGRKPVSLKLRHETATSVNVAGTFNGWDVGLHPLQKAETGEWQIHLELEPGRHEYLFVADGCWLTDPMALDWVENPYGGRNSVMIL